LLQLVFSCHGAVHCVDLDRANDDYDLDRVDPEAG
jgi:hypothetical protein